MASFTNAAGNVETDTKPNDTDTALVISKPTNTAEGKLLLAGAAVDAGGRTWTGPAGFTELFDTDEGTVSFAVWYKIATASEPSTYTFTPSAAEQQAGFIIVIDLPNRGSPIQTSSNSTATTTSGTANEHHTGANGVTTTEDETLCIETIGSDDDDDVGAEHVPSHATAVTVSGFSANGFLPSGEGTGHCMVGLAFFTQASAGTTPTTDTEDNGWNFEGTSVATEGVVKATIAIANAITVDEWYSDSQIPIIGMPRMIGY